MAFECSRPTAEAAVPPLADAELIRRAQLGEVAAFAALYDRHAAMVLALGRRLLGSSSDAEDLLHDVFLEAWQAVREYVPARGGVSTWLFVRARSRALDRWKRKQRERSARLELEAMALVAVPSRMTDTRLAVRAALDELDAPARGAVELMYLHGLTAAEIAACTHVPEGTVRSRLARGLHRLEQVLQ